MALKYIGGLWLKKDKNGKTYMSGTMELQGRDGPKTNFMVYKNEHKEPGSKHPDYQIVQASDDVQQSQPMVTDDLPF